MNQEDRQQEDRQQADSQEADNQDMGFEEQLVQGLVISGQITDSAYKKILQRLKEKASLSDALKEHDEIGPELLSTYNDCKALVDQGKISISQLIVAMYDYQTANIPIKEALCMRGWLNH